MPSDSPPAAVPAPEIPAPIPPNQPGLLELFVAFAKMSLAGFGGVLVWARRGIVDQHRWMTAEEFNETFALCHFLPGPNIVNLSVVFGSRFRGIAGGIAAFAGLHGDFRQATNQTTIDGPGTHHEVKPGFVPLTLTTSAGTLVAGF